MDGWRDECQNMLFLPCRVGIILSHAILFSRFSATAIVDGPSQFDRDSRYSQSCCYALCIVLLLLLPNPFVLSVRITAATAAAAAAVVVDADDAVSTVYHVLLHSSKIFDDG